MSIEQSILRSYFDGKKLRELYKEYNSYIVQKVLHSNNVLKYCFKNFDNLPSDIIYQILKRSRHFNCDSLTWKSINEIKQVGLECSLKVCCYMLNKPSMSVVMRPYSHVYVDDIVKVTEPVKNGYVKLKWSKSLVRSISKIVFTGVYILKQDKYLKIIIDSATNYDSLILNLSKINLKPYILQYYVDLILKPVNQSEILQNILINIDNQDSSSDNGQVKEYKPVIDDADELF